jgi:hypothetical protein
MRRHGHIASALHDGARTEVAVGDPYRTRLRRSQQRLDDDTFLGVRVLAGQHVGNQAAIRVVDQQFVRQPPLGDLFFGATRGVTITVVLFRKWKRRQPGLPTNRPQLVSGPQLVRGIQRSQVHFDLVCADRED